MQDDIEKAPQRCICSPCCPTPHSYTCMCEQRSFEMYVWMELLVLFSESNAELEFFLFGKIFLWYV